MAPRPSALCFLALLVLALPAQAGHVPCPPEDCVAIQPAPALPFVQGPVQLDAFRASVQAGGEMAETRIAMELGNPGATAAEATLAFPMPGGATLLGFNLTTDNRTLEGRVEESGRASQEYQQAKEQGRDAVLLRQADDRHLILTVIVPPGAHRTLSAHYVEWLDLANGARIYRLPLSRLPSGVGRVDVDAAIAGAGLAGVAAPLQPMDIAASEAGATGSTHLVAPATLKDLVLTWTVPAGWQASILSSTASGWGEGAAVACLGTGTPLARDVVFILDRSGSMAGAKITEARESLRAVLPTLLPGDFYDVVLFDDQLDPLHSSLQAATPQRVAQDQAALASVQERGGTDLDSGLQTALAELNATPGDRLPMIVLLTDGLPTVGITDHQRIIQRFVDGNARHARIHVVPIGLDADYTFLADLALRSGGSFTPLDPGDGHLALRLERLYDVVGHSLVRDVQATIGGLETADVLPRVLPDLAEDRCLRVVFRGDWSGTSNVTFTVTGRDAGGPVRQVFTIPRSAVLVRPAVSALWGRAQVDDLLAQEHAGTVSRGAVVENATALRQLSPDTSWIIADSQVPFESAPVQDAGSPGSARAFYAPGHTTAGAAGTGAVQSAASQAPGPTVRAPGGLPTAQTPSLGVASLLAVALLVAWARRGRQP